MNISIKELSILFRRIDEIITISIYTIMWSWVFLTVIAIAVRGNYMDNPLKIVIAISYPIIFLILYMRNFVVGIDTHKPIQSVLSLIGYAMAIFSIVILLAVGEVMGSISDMKDGILDSSLAQEYYRYSYYFFIICCIVITLLAVIRGIDEAIQREGT